MGAIIKNKNGGTHNPRAYTYNRKKDFKVITLLSNGKTYVEHVVLADSLIAKKLAKEVKGVDFEITKPHIKFIEEVKQ